MVEFVVDEPGLERGAMGEDPDRSHIGEGLRGGDIGRSHRADGLQHDQGPCVDCFRTGRFVGSASLTDDANRWPRFVAEATAAGLQSAWALPLRLRDTTIGSLNLLRAAPGILTDDDLVAAQALADVATNGLRQQRAAEDARFLSDQLQTALDSRVAIEQAKGVLAERANLSMGDGFDALREYARNSNLRLTDVERTVANRDVELVDRIIANTD